MKTTTTVRFDTREFVLSHGAAPRGRGSWAFSTKQRPTILDPKLLWSPTLTFSEAKRWAKAQVQGTGLNVVLFVQP